MKGCAAALVTDLPYLTRPSTVHTIVFRFGVVAYADKFEEIAGAALGLVTAPPIEELAANLEFELFQISQEEFEVVWRDAELGKWPVRL